MDSLLAHSGIRDTIGEMLGQNISTPPRDAPARAVTTPVHAPVPTASTPPPPVVDDAPPLDPSHAFALTGPSGDGSDGIGFTVIDGFLGQPALLRARKEVGEMDSRGLLRAAGMSRGVGQWCSKTSRGDRTVWLTAATHTALFSPTAEAPPSRSPAASPGAPTAAAGGGAAAAGTTPSPALDPDADKSVDVLPPGLRHVMARLAAVHAHLRASCPGLQLVDRFSAQLACYAGDGARYAQHRDAFPPTDPSEPVRRITALYYMNPAWEPADGGVLRLELPESAPVPPHTTWDVEPTGDRLLLFTSHNVPHEVLPAFSTRFAVTMWMYGVMPAPQSGPASAITPVPRSLAAPTPPLLPKSPALEPPATTALSDARPCIFVSIVSYRDPECQHTVQDLFERATWPSHVFVGICGQYHVTQDEHCRAVPWSRPSQVREITLQAQDAAGPAWARHLAMSLYRGEEFVLQIDSHMRFVPGWDMKLLEQLSACPSRRPVLSTYPQGYTLPDNVPPLSTARPTLMCAKGFGDDGFPRFRGRPLKKSQEEPIRSRYWAAGFSFSSADLFTEVPLDPQLRHMFFGEEYAFLARAWTSGWDMFAPGVPILFHLWARGDRPSFREFSSPREALQENKAADRVKAMLRGELKPGAPFGLGTERSLKDFLTFTGLSLETQSMSDVAKNGGAPLGLLEPLDEASERAAAALRAIGALD